MIDSPHRLRASVGTLLALLLGGAAPAAAQTEELRGRVLQEDGRPIPWATVAAAGSQVVADADARFRLAGLQRGTLMLVVSAPGFGVTERRVDVPAADDLVVVLRPDPVALDALTVTGTMKRVSVAASPVKVEVIPAAVLARSATNNLTEALRHVNGVATQLDCGVCYTNGIRIHGMAGPYTAVLIDGMPIMGALASVYGLNGINPSLIEQVEIVKGPSSTLYGSEAMAGVVNVVTKDPRFAPRWSVDASASDDAEANLDFAFTTEPGELSALFSGNVAYDGRYVDDNDDGFSDFPLERRAVLFAKADLHRDGRPRGALTARAFFEERFGGVEGFTPTHRGSDSVYGESIRTGRMELLGTWHPGPLPSLRVEGSFTLHTQDSYYGATPFQADQRTALLNALWSASPGRHDLLAGLTLRHLHYDDDTPATARAERRVVPGLLVQDEVRWDRLSLLAGLRVDRHAEHGTILSPRVAAKWEPWEHTAVRLNAGTGFRVVSVFTEDHAALTGARDVVLEDALAPERSRSVTLNLNQVVEMGPHPMMIDLDLFHTRFSNKIVPDYDRDPDLIVYGNLDGHAISRGVSLALNQNVGFDRFLYSFGVTWQDVFQVAPDGARARELFAPELRGVASATLALRSLPLTLDYSATVTGPMRLPSYPAPFERPERSPTFALHDVRLAWRLPQESELYLAIANVLDHVQPSPLVDPERPFGDAFDTSYVYGPLRGRSLRLGLRYGVAR
ncbi:MAG: TonB-dependent receptor [Gemmatimonadota bacterium]